MVKSLDYLSDSRKDVDLDLTVENLRLLVPRQKRYRQLIYQIRGLLTIESMTCSLPSLTDDPNLLCHWINNPEDFHVYLD